MLLREVAFDKMKMKSFLRNSHLEHWASKHQTQSMRNWGVLAYPGYKYERRIKFGPLKSCSHLTLVLAYSQLLSK